MSLKEAPDFDNPDVLEAQIAGVERTRNRALATALAGSLLFAALDTAMKVPAIAQAVSEGPVTRVV